MNCQMPAARATEIAVGLYALSTIGSSAISLGMLRQIAEQAAAQKQADDQAAQRERAQADAASATSKGGSGGVSRTAVDLNLNLNGAGGAFGLDLSKLSVQQKDAFARELGPSIIAWLKRQKQLAGA